MRKANKAGLRNRILQFKMRSDTKTSGIYIVDGGTLFNQSNWNPQCIYNELPEQYLQYVTLRYNNGGLKLVAAFDGYDDMHLTKSVKNYHPGEGVVVAPDIKIANLQMKVLEKKNEFLRDVNYKKAL